MAHLVASILILIFAPLAIASCHRSEDLGHLPDGGAGAGGAAAGSAGVGGQAGIGGNMATDAGSDMPPACGAGGTGGNQPAGMLAFQPAGNYAVGRKYYSSISLADVSGDGKPDLIVAGNMTISVFVNRGDGTFRDKSEYLTRERPRIAVGDLDGDGKLDLAVATDYPGGVDVFSNSGGGAFAPAVTYAATGLGSSIAIADLNGDGKNDIAVTSAYVNSASLVLLLNTGGGTFSTASYPAPNQVTSVAVGDLNGDSRPDLVIGDSGSGNGPGGVNLFANMGSGMFALTSSFGATTNPYDISIADLNGDGKPDMVLAGFTGDADVLLNAGSGTFGAAVGYSPGQAGLDPTLNGPAALRLGDLDGDGKPDIAFASPQSGVGALLNRGNGTFGAPSTFPFCSSPGLIALGDLNGDGKLDITVTTADGVSVLFNSTP